MDDNKIEDDNIKPDIIIPHNQPLISQDSVDNITGTTYMNNLSLSDKNIRDLENISSKGKEVLIDKPNPWTKIIVNERHEYPYLFHLKVKIPSLNDFENWKQIIPNIEFDPRSGELIIPSKDEASALAVANLIVTNFSGQLSLQDIISKNLIQISISKAKTYELVQGKLRDQIMENLYGSQNSTLETNYVKDLARNQVESFTRSSSRVDFKSDSFKDTFEHFTSNNVTNQGIEAWEGNGYSYL